MIQTWAWPKKQLVPPTSHSEPVAIVREEQGLLLWEQIVVEQVHIQSEEGHLLIDLDGRRGQ